MAPGIYIAKTSPGSWFDLVALHLRRVRTVREKVATLLRIRLRSEADVAQHSVFLRCFVHEVWRAFLLTGLGTDRRHHQGGIVVQEVASIFFGTFVLVYLLILKVF